MAPSVATTPPILQGPSAKEKKYDRQLRLWGANGQQALESSHILLLNSGAGVAGIETLKNLVLPGTGTFTIVDEAVVGEEDLGVNFFLEQSSLGKSRAEECCRLLLELNPEVKGFGVQKTIADFVGKSDLSQYTLVLLVAPTGSFDLASEVSQIAWDLRQPLIYIHSVGFYSHISVQLPPSFPIVDTHPDPETTQDLRLLQPWPELLDYTRAKTADLETFSDHDHGHIPWILLLLHYLEKWKESHNSELSMKDKIQFRNFVSSQARRDNAEGGEENYDEAIGAANRSLTLPSIPSDLKTLLAEDECQNPRNSSANFWLIANAISTFTTQHNLLPVPGTVPDMKAQSKDYIALQSLYRTKSQRDISEVTTHVRTLEQKLNRHIPISAREIESFCKNAAFVKLIHGRKLIIDPLNQGWSDNPTTTITQHTTSMNFVTGKPSLFPILIALYAFDSAMASSLQAGNILAASASPHFARDMEVYIREVFGKLDNTEDLAEVLQRTLALAKEIQRSGPGELHNISSLTGGMIAQEVIKIITKQYVPVDNCLVFDGIESASAVYRL